MQKPLFVAMSLLPSNAALNRCHMISFSHFDTPDLLLIDIVTQTEHNHAAFALELEEPWRAATPLVQGQTLFLFSLKLFARLRLNDVFQHFLY